MRLVVGAPVRRREWIAEHWVDHVAWATVEAGIRDESVELVFVAHPDDPTIDRLQSAADRYGLPVTIIEDPVDPPTVIERSWTTSRIHTMVRVRNELLGAVRELEPDVFLSLDSDILIQQKALRAMMRLLCRGGVHKRPAAAGHCVYLDQRSTQFPNYAMLTPRGNMRREPLTGDVPNVHVLMAAKLMTPAAYKVDYEFDRRGEDIGWSLAVRRQGMHLAWTGAVTSKHCMDPADVDRVDKRVGY